METSDDRLFVDTSYFIARFNLRDQHHSRALSLDGLVARCHELWTTEAVLLEFAAAFSTPELRLHAVRTWDQFHRGGPHFAKEATSDLMNAAMDLFRSRMDKSWSLADCLSFVVMEQLGISAALTSDYHFVQAGFRALILDD